MPCDPGFRNFAWSSSIQGVAVPCGSVAPLFYPAGGRAGPSADSLVRDGFPPSRVGRWLRPSVLTATHSPRGSVGGSGVFAVKCVGAGAQVAFIARAERPTIRGPSNGLHRKCDFRGPVLTRQRQEWGRPRGHGGTGGASCVQVTGGLRARTRTMPSGYVAVPMLSSTARQHGKCYAAYWVRL